MKAPKMELKLGAEPRKVMVLAVLLALAAYLFYANVLSGPEQPASTRPQPARPAVVASTPKAAPPVTRRDLTTAKTAPRDFRPSLKAAKGEDRSTLDPSLRLDLLAKLAAVNIERVERSLFDFGAVEAPRPKLAEPKIEVKKPVARMIGPEPPPPPPAPPVKPPPPPINLKFYGSAVPVRGGVKHVFCLQGEEIIVLAEGEVLQRRYKIVKINATSVMVEDLDYKHQQSVPIDQPVPSA